MANVPIHPLIITNRWQSSTGAAMKIDWKIRRLEFDYYPDLKFTNAHKKMKEVIIVAPVIILPQNMNISQAR